MGKRKNYKLTDSNLILDGEHASLYRSQNIMYTWNLYNVIKQYYLNKNKPTPPEKKQNWSFPTTILIGFSFLILWTEKKREFLGNFSVYTHKFVMS